MIPQGSTLQAAGSIDVEEQPSRTYRMDLEKGRIGGNTDGLEAIKQAAFKILQTERFHYLIYSTNYGSEINGLVGSSPLFVQSELRRRISEALLQDDRITSIDSMQFSFTSDSVLVRFTVITNSGSFNMEVTQSV